jgi:hypothetical protein
MKNLVFLIGLLMVSYGLFWAVPSGSLLKGILWALAGVCLQIAGGAASPTGQRGGLKNPLVVLTKELRTIRERVQGWDRRGRQASAVAQPDAADGAGTMERRS